MSGGDDIPFVHRNMPALYLKDGIWVPCHGPDTIKIGHSGIECSECGGPVVRVRH